MTEKQDTCEEVFAWLERNAQNVPEKIAVRSLDQDKEITYGELFELANRIGNFYQARGIGRNDRVALLSNN